MLQRISSKRDAVKKIILRTLKLLFWGILLQGGYSHAPADLTYGVDMKSIRWCGILQRIALVYMFVALIETLTIKQRQTVLQPNYFTIFTAYQWQWIGGFVAFLIYMVTTYSLYVPDWSFIGYEDHEAYTVKCGMRGHLGPACNAVGYVDREVWGINHLYQFPVWSRLKACTLSSPGSGPLREDAPSWCRAPFEPEGLLSTISAILSGTIGIHFGHVLIHFKNHSERLKQWVSTGFGLLIIAIILHFTDAIPINKQLYSFSYVCFTAGAAAIVFSGFYILIDVWGLRTPFLFLEWIGMNAMLVYVMAAQGIFEGFINGWYYKSPDNTLVYWIQKHVFVKVWHSERLGTLLYVIFAQITFWAVVAGILHRLRIYWKL
ncbi:heparan-alpha-glucosaminide N-acetyltransferase [Jatropha curcas]|uniref:heparan-alpha-glucosaminide N-acetyltransferase n=1 Tax=Jatropha curcas TaxID=180498 RepID=UPI0018942F99|nr:heparan-alpha-glucosaminide N-acetyltransferase [Jatropha curcas]